MKIPKLVKRIGSSLGVIFTVEDVGMLKIKAGDTIEIIAPEPERKDFDLNTCPGCGELIDISKALKAHGLIQCPKCFSALNLNKKTNELEVKQ